MKTEFSDIIIRTKRLVIRPLNPSDYDSWLRAYTQRFAKKHKYDRGPHDPKETPRSWFNKLIKRHRKIASDDKVYVFGVFDKKTNEHVGALDFSTIQRLNMSWANVGYSVHNTHQGKGYAKEFLHAGIHQIAFEILKYKRVEAAINLDNKRSINLAKSVGMKRECIRKEFFFENNQWVDHVIYTALSKSKKLEE